MALGQAYIEIVGDVSKFAPDLRRSLTSVFKLGAITGVAAVASSHLLGVAGAITQLGGAAVAIPAGIAVASAAIGALKLATSGLGEAFSAAATGDAAAFEKSLENLSPRAQQLARELRGVKPAMDAVRSSAQDAFAGPLIGQITATSGVISGPLRTGLAGIAAEYGQIARRALEFVRQSASVSALTAVLNTTRTAIAGAGVAVGPLLAGFRDLAVVALPTLSRLAQLAGPLAAQFGAWMSQMAASGAAAQALQGAVQVLTQLGQVAVNVGGIISAALRAAAEGGGGSLLSALVQLTGQLKAFLNSATGQQALTSLFSTISTLAAGLGPILTTLLGIIARSILPALAEVAAAVLPAVQAIADGLGPAIAALAPVAAKLIAALAEGIRALAPALGPIGEVIASVVSALTPLLPVVGQLIAMLIGPLATALSALGPLIAPLVTALGPVLLQLGRTLTDALAPIARLLADLFRQLGPVIGQLVAALGTALAPALDAVAPVVTALVEALMPLIPAIVDLVPAITEIVVAAAPLTKVLAELLILAAQILAPLIKLAAVLVQMMVSKAVAPLISWIASALADLLAPLTGVADWIGRLSTAIAGIDWAEVGAAISGAFSAAWQAVARFFAGLGEFLTSLPGRLLAALAALPGLLVGALKFAFDSGLRAVGVGIGLLVYSVTTLPGRIMAALQSLAGSISRFFTGVWSSATSLASRGIASLVSFATGLPGRISAAWSRLPGVLGSLLNNAFNATRRAASSGISSVVSYVARVPGRLSGLAGRFVSAGTNLIGGFMRGLRRVGSLGDIAASITAAVRSGLNNVIGRINSGIADIDRYLPGSLPRIPYLADGAVVNRATLAVLGEAGREVVIPLTRPRRARELAEQSGLMDLLGAGEGGGGAVMFGRGAISITFEGAVPTRQEALQVGQAVGEGVSRTLARRDVATTVRTL
ncbi:phage tail protein [Couchioplanes caeruleus]|uniref:Phage-related protein n=2 Tax=Couchioplanes caeruleus TaxID=56438 RepID=A0A1K0GDS7_9ACTN|nr:hypothetical protein [Couchioplanes caeruleus]OJF15386.1 hypothetical protein BG844_04605 [Couchioplanes caeruleus subsp. caeruleus]ROP33425.1 phage-related protein [Couchioplanes caeruleus]